MAASKNDLEYLQDALGRYQATAKQSGVDIQSFTALRNNSLTKISDDDFYRIIRLISLKQKLARDFNNQPIFNYSTEKKTLENLATIQMTYLMDGRLVDFHNQNKATATTLRSIIRNKKRFPKEEFAKLKEAFPCILAGIRDYADYIPLEPEIFDLVIIDEASQVSIAQAFPALLRAKSVLILGDKRQFSNVKAAHARSDTNREHLSSLERVFRKNISVDAAKLERLIKFNIKTSILEFFEFISNYNTQLRKHFRGYKENISYSNKHFYKDSLQVMKIRGKRVDDVLRFSVIEHDGKAEITPNTNLPEIEFIIGQLKQLRDDGSKPSVGIITPHTNQQKLAVELINKLPGKDYYFDELRLKIMTFDTCQGEERDIIFYSMVATKECDRLWGVFIKNLENVDIEEDGQIKAQRLNVGFSRAKECMHFILSKPLDEYSGSIGEALRHYAQVLDEARQEKGIDAVDPRSKMEPQVLNWFYQTQFWQQNKESIEFIPQFEIGKYLRQLNPTYEHADYKVDFLLVYQGPTNREEKIIVEYDGFYEHFRDSEGIDQYNYEAFYTAEDVYREKVLESYGYKFLRINRFNVGDNPIETLDDRLKKLTTYSANEHRTLTNIRHTIEGLQNGQMKECPKCKEVRNATDFADASLVTGYGRFCKDCKTMRAPGTKSTRRKAGAKKQRACPKCESAMVLRNGRYGQFYGCSKYPYCRGTRPYK